MDSLELILRFFEGLPPIGVFVILVIALLVYIACWSNKATDNLSKLMRAFGDMRHGPRETDDHQRRSPGSRDATRGHPPSPRETDDHQRRPPGSRDATRGKQSYEQGYQQENESRRRPQQRPPGSRDTSHGKQSYEQGYQQENESRRRPQRRLQ
jgi:hypothetical protein